MNRRNTNLRLSLLVAGPLLVLAAISVPVWRQARQSQIDLTRIRPLVALSHDASHMVLALQNERASHLLQGNAEAAAAMTEATDAALAGLERAGRPADTGAHGNAFAVSELRGEMLRLRGECPSGAAFFARCYDAYSRLIERLITQCEDIDLRAAPAGVSDRLALHEAVLRLRNSLGRERATVLAAMAAGRLSEAQLTELAAAREAERIYRRRVESAQTAPEAAELSEALETPGAADTGQIIDQLLASQGREGLPADAGRWYAMMDHKLAGLHRYEETLLDAAMREMEAKVGAAGDAETRLLAAFLVVVLLGAAVGTQLARQVARGVRELERLNTDKNRFLGIAAHDLHNPLTTVHGFTEILLRERAGPLTPAQRDLLTRIGKSAVNMRTLVSDLLDVSAIESGHLPLHREPLDLQPLLARVIRDVKMLADEKQVKILFAAQAAMPKVNADPARLDQIFQNLLSNALKYSPQGGTVRVDLQGIHGRVMVSVADQGVGIPKTEQAQLFKPFTRLSPRPTNGEKSTGLGLAITQRIVTDHGGRIWVESDAGKGAAFFVALPVADTLTR